MEPLHRCGMQLSVRQVIASLLFVIFFTKQTEAWARSGGGGLLTPPDVQAGQMGTWQRDGEAGLTTVTNVTAQLGSSAFLLCTQPSRPLDRPAEVSWLRRRDWHLLTTGKTVFIRDERFHIFHDPAAGSWVLKISFVRLRDRGLYECQISTSSGRLARLVHLHVVQPVPAIQGTGVYHVERGSSISLACDVRQVVSSTVLVVWHHNGKVLNPYKLRADMQVSLRHGDHQTVSTLSITDVRLDDSGNYTCSAGNARAASVAVFVSQGDKMAAIQRRKAESSAGAVSVSLALLLLLPVSVSVSVSASVAFLLSYTTR